MALGKYKIINIILLIILSFSFFTGCFNKGNTVQMYEVKGKIIEINLANNWVMVSGADEDSLKLIGDKCVFSSDKVKILDKTNNEIIKDNLKVGDFINIKYNGVIQESYPCRITGVEEIKIY